MFARLATNAYGKPQLMVRIGDRDGPCMGSSSTDNRRLYVTQNNRKLLVVYAHNFSHSCSQGTVILPLQGDFDPAQPFVLEMYPYHFSALEMGQ